MSYHLSVARLIAYLIQIHCSLVHSQTVQSIIWNVPNGNLTDLSQTFTAGTSVPLSWNGWPYPDYLDAVTTLVDLWVTAFDYNANPFSELLIENINVTIPGGFAWTIAIPDSNLVTSPKYVLRFEPNSASTYNSNTPQLSSPGFLVVKAAVSSTSEISSSNGKATSTSSIGSTTSRSSTATTYQNPLNTANSPPNQSPGTSSSLSTSAAGGIGAGVAILVLGLIGITYLVLKRRRSRSMTNEELNLQLPMGDMTLAQATHESSSFPVELGQGKHQSTRFPVELPTR